MHASHSGLVAAIDEIEVMRQSGVSLSARETMIVLLMGQGFTNKGIARQLSIAPETVKSHAKRIFWKLEAQSRAQAVYRASALGLISLGIGMSADATSHSLSAFAAQSA